MSISSVRAFPLRMAYHLYNICERKRWAAEALAYDKLVVAWLEISKLTRSAPETLEKQGEMIR